MNDGAVAVKWAVLAGQIELAHRMIVSDIVRQTHNNLSPCLPLSSSSPRDASGFSDALDLGFVDDLGGLSQGITCMYMYP